MEILRVRHNWPENAGFTLSRPNGTGDFVLLHFHGSVELSFGNETRETRPGALIILSPQTSHRIYSRGPLLHDWIHMTGAIAEEMRSFGLAPDVLYQPTCSSRITDIISMIETEHFAMKTHASAFHKALLVQLFILLARDLACETEEPVSTETETLLRALRAEMLMHPEQKWTNAQMAQKLNVSVSHLYPLYKRMFSISPNRDLILIRVEKAKNMLLQGKTVSETSELMGYTSVYHFIRQFRAIAGCTPGQFTKAK